MGPEATFTHQAARSKFGASVEYIPAATISEVFDRVQNRTADYGVVPIENSTEGGNAYLRSVCTTSLKICAEIYLPISLTLLSKVEREQVRVIYSKQEVFGCRTWLQTHLPEVELSRWRARRRRFLAMKPRFGGDCECDGVGYVWN